MKKYVFIRPSIDSCYCLSEFARSDEFDLLRKQKEQNEETKDIPKEEKVAKNDEKQKKPKPDLISKEGRKEAVKREEVTICFDNPNYDNEQALKDFNKKNYLALTIWPYYNYSFDKDILDRVFAYKVASISAPFKYLNNQEFLDYIADKLEERTKTIFEIVCLNQLEETESEYKGFFNITHYQREKIAKIIRENKWDEETFEKDLFGNLTYVHSFQIR